MNRAFIPLVVGEAIQVMRSGTWGDAPGWYETAPLVLTRARHRLLWWWEMLLYQPVLATFETFWKKQGGKSTSRASMNTPGVFPTWRGPSSTTAGVWSSFCLQA
ncbi:MAG: hypothetical protein IPH35_00250 [Rhodoferax sp.]|nr:hypothetical protein [Rhodoferax sp.]